MTTATLRISTPLPEARTAPRKGLLARFFDAMVEARMRQAMRETRAAPPSHSAEDLLKKRRLRRRRATRTTSSADPVHALSTSVTHSPSGMRRTSVSPCGR